jgi:hypothetical protein
MVTERFLMAGLRGAGGGAGEPGLTTTTSSELDESRWFTTV